MKRESNIQNMDQRSQRTIDLYQQIRAGQVKDGRYCPRECSYGGGGKCTGIASSDRTRPWVEMSNGHRFDGNTNAIIEIPSDCPFGLVRR